MAIEMTDEFERALDVLDAGENILLTGRAGTGKSTLLRQFIDLNEHRNLLVTAPTGVAALNIGGLTIHKAFGFWPGLYPDDLGPDGRYHPSGRTTAVLKAMDVLVVDEVSMVRADLFDMMDVALQRIRGSDKPYGGVQLVLVGDLLQLPPVLPDYERDAFLQRWETPYFFSARCYPDLHLAQIELKKVWRQTDPEFVEILNQIREGSVSDEVLAILNDRVDPDFAPDEDWVTLTSRRRTVDQINQGRLAALPGQNFQSVAERGGEADTKDFPGSEVLDYAVGARVMTVINDAGGDFVNGSFGVIVAADGDTIAVALDNGNLVELRKHIWESKRPVLDSGRLTSEVIGTIKQFPIVLAWAITIHKSQGKTIPKCHINLKGGTTTEGQFYVALSRAVDLENLRFNQPVEEKNINADGTLVRMIQRESAPEADTSRMVFLSFEGVDFSMTQHIARIHAVIIVNGEAVADFGSWINPMSDLGTFGEKHEIPSAGLALVPALGEFWPLLRRQAAGGIIIADKLAVFERAVRHQEKGMEIGLGIGYDISDLDYTPNGDDVITRAHDMARAYLDDKFVPHRGRPAPKADLDTEGSVYVPNWAPQQPMALDANRATDSDVAWAALSGAQKRPESRGEITEALEIMSGWAISRGGWNAERREELLSRAARITSGEVELPEAETRTADPAVLFAPGARVAFTGQIALNGQVLRKDEELAPICEELGLVYKKGMSKSKCDVLVANDMASMSRKAQAAREYDKPIVSTADFEAWYNNPQQPVIVEETPDEYTTTSVAIAEPPTAPTTPETAGIGIRSADEVLTEGTRVAFRGSIYVGNEHFPHGERLQELCNDLGLEYKQAVTRSRCDVLISDAPEAMDGKAKLAAMYHKPTVVTADFEQWAQEKLEDHAIREDLETSIEPSAAPPVALLTPPTTDTGEHGGKPTVNDGLSGDAAVSRVGPDPREEPVAPFPRHVTEPTGNEKYPAVSPPNAIERLFQGRTFNEFNQLNDGLALVSGDTAWLCDSRPELISRLGSLAEPEPATQQPQPAHGRHFWWAMAASFLLFWGGGMIGAAGSDTVGVLLVLVSLVVFCVGVVYAFKWVKNKSQRAKENSQPRELPLERSLGGPVERELPVLLVNRESLSPTQRSVATELTGLYGWLRAHGHRIGVHEWRDLAQSTLDAVSHYEMTGDPGLVDQSARRIDNQVNAK